MVRQIDISDEVGTMFVLHESYSLKKEICFALNSWIENDVCCTVEISCLRSTRATILVWICVACTLEQALLLRCNRILA